MMKSGNTFGLPVLVLGSALGLTAFAQTSTPPTQTTDQAAASSMNPNDSTTYATGKRERVPLDGVVGATDAEVKGPDGTLTRVPVIDKVTDENQRYLWGVLTQLGPDAKDRTAVQQKIGDYFAACMD